MSEKSADQSQPLAEPVSLNSEAPETPLPVQDPAESVAQEARWQEEWSARSSTEKEFDD